MTNYVESRVTPVEKKIEQAPTTVNNIVDAVARNPLPIIETAVLIAADVPPNVASAAVSAANGGKPQDIAASYAGSTLASNVIPTDPNAPITTAAERGAVSGATKAVLTGQDVAKGAAAGGATGGVSTALTEGYKSLLPDKVDYSIAPTQQSGLGLKATPSTDASNYGIYDATGTTSSGTGLSATPSTSGYLLGESTGGQGLQATGVTPTSSVTQGPQLSNIEKQLAGYVAQDIVRQAGLADTSGTTPKSAAQPAATSATTSAVTLGSQQSPTATTGADVAALDTTTGEGLGSKEGKKGGKYPWGDPEGTTALKQEGQVI
jgi:hypothetical protein